MLREINAGFFELRKKDQPHFGPPLRDSLTKNWTKKKLNSSPWRNIWIIKKDSSSSY